MSLKGKKVFTRRPSSAFLYKWAPNESLNKKKKTLKKSKLPFCTATPNSNGEDFNVTYVYNEVIDPNGVVHRYAYVECDYVV